MGEPHGWCALKGCLPLRSVLQRGFSGGCAQCCGGRCWVSQYKHSIMVALQVWPRQRSPIIKIQRLRIALLLWLFSRKPCKCTTFPSPVSYWLYLKFLFPVLPPNTSEEFEGCLTSRKSLFCIISSGFASKIILDVNTIFHLNLLISERNVFNIMTRVWD